MNTYTDEQLKQTLVKMLPHRIVYPGFYWQGECSEGRGFQPCILDTELLHLCWLVEISLDTKDWLQFRGRLLESAIIGRDISSTWQQRTIALAQTLGIEIV